MQTTGRDPAANPAAAPPQAGMRQALGLMEQALKLLDDHEGPNDAGAHLDLAVHRLRDWLESGTD